MKKDEIGNRMKEFYENRSKTFLTRRIPVIIRVDGKAFHTYTKSLEKPFDKGLIEDMNETAIYLCKNIQGAKCAYVQSDEISVLITDFDELTTDAWFDYNIQKMTSISASITTGKFNQLRLYRYIQELNRELADSDGCIEPSWKLHTLEHIYGFDKLAHFDSRCFNIPKEDVANYFLWRQQDCVRNSISSVAQSLYSHKELHGKNSNVLQEMIFQKGINWNDFSTGEKRGRWIVKNNYVNTTLVNEHIKKGVIMEEDRLVIRTKWEVVETPEKFNYSHFETYLK